MGGGEATFCRELFIDSAPFVMGAPGCDPVRPSDTLSTSAQVQIGLHATRHCAPCVKTNDQGAGISTPASLAEAPPETMAADAGGQRALFISSARTARYPSAPAPSAQASAELFISLSKCVGSGASPLLGIHLIRTASPGSLRWLSVDWSSG